MKLRLFIVTFILYIASVSYAQDKFVSTQFSIGHLNQLDTYLSNEKYRGSEWRFISEVIRDSHKHPLTYSLIHEGAFANTHNRSENANELSGHYDFAYAVMRKFSLNLSDDSRLNLYAGLYSNIDLGFCYNTRTSSNNPAQGYASLNLGPQVMGRYSFHLWRKSMTLSYEARVPFVGIMFSPNYGQSYYEIFNEGVYDHNVVVTSVATFQLRQQLSLDIKVSPKTAIRIGYLCDIRQATPNNLKQHQWYNAALIGVTLRR
ncbi:MAG: DUF3316 domain-containing protein [Prevotella sp.]|nr:DUF3316 domain-containing protein [Prevotella sp.]